MIYLTGPQLTYAYAQFAMMALKVLAASVVAVAM